MIKEVIGAVGGAFILICSMQYVVYQFINDGEPLEMKKFTLLCFFQGLIIIGLNFINQGISRVSIIYIVTMVFSKFLYKKNVLKTILSSFLMFILMIISETIFSLIIVFVGRISIETFKEGYFLTFLSNVFISLILLILSAIRFIKKFFRNLISNVSNFQINKIFVLVILSIFTITSLAYYMYFEINALNTIILNLFLIFVYSCLTIMFFKENNEKLVIKSKYYNIVNTSEQYEKVIEQLRMNNHENKNNLIVLKGMLKNENNELKEYVDNLIDDNRKEDNNLLLRTSSIPTGGLQGLIYQKLLDMKEQEIHYYLDVNKNIDKKKIEKIDMEINKDLCTIVGVFLDNAIQAVENINEKSIGIYLYQEKDEFVISISNTYQGKIDLENMYNKGYTTKSEGHGYGLSLVKEILDKNQNFKNERLIRGNMFIQKIKLYLNKK